MIAPRALLDIFAAFVGLGPEIVELFLEARPDLLEAPAPAPASDIDPAVAAEIKREEL